MKLLLSAQSSCQNGNFVNTSEKLLKTKIGIFPCSLFYIKSKVCLKYFVHNCRFSISIILSFSRSLSKRFSASACKMHVFCMFFYCYIGYYDVLCCDFIKIIFSFLLFAYLTFFLKLLIQYFHYSFIGFRNYIDHIYPILTCI